MSHSRMIVTRFRGRKKVSFHVEVRNFEKSGWLLTLRVVSWRWELFEWIIWIIYFLTDVILKQFYLSLFDKRSVSKLLDYLAPSSEIISWNFLQYLLLKFTSDFVVWILLSAVIICLFQLINSDERLCRIYQMRCSYNTRYYKILH